MANDNTISPPDQRANWKRCARLRGPRDSATSDRSGGARTPLDPARSGVPHSRLWMGLDFDVKALRIIVDLDNTIADEFGRRVRPGMVEFLETLAAEGHQLVLWTSSTGERAELILAEHDLERHFTRLIFREDYDHQSPKDISAIGGQVIIDDDPAQIDAAEASGALGLLITPYRGGEDPSPGELDEILKAIRRLARRGFWRWIGRG